MNFLSLSLKIAVFLWLKKKKKDVLIITQKALNFLILCKLGWHWFSCPISFWHRFPNSDVILAFESMHGLDDSQNEEVSKQTSPVGFYTCIHWHCSIHCHDTGECWYCFCLVILRNANWSIPHFRIESWDPWGICVIFFFLEMSELLQFVSFKVWI